MRHLSLILVGGFVLFCAGCHPVNDANQEEFGTIVMELPQKEPWDASLPLPEGVDSGCKRVTARIPSSFTEEELAAREKEKRSASSSAKKSSTKFKPATPTGSSEEPGKDAIQDKTDE